MSVRRLGLKKRLLRPAGYAVGLVAVGAASFYAVNRPRVIPGTENTPPLKFRPDGTIVPPAFAALPSRDNQIARLKASGETDDPFDLLIIGGGATGAGIALDAATRGLRVAMVEQDDFSAGTSSKSTKLVHGGVRYLEKAVMQLDYAQFKLVVDALRERRYFLDTAPHLSNWLPIMIPLDRWWKIPYFWVGTKAYDVLAGRDNVESSFFLTRSKALDAFPMLNKSRLVGALVYYDGAHNDARMNVSLAVTAAHYGATVVNHMRVTSLTKDADGKLTGATVTDTASPSGQFAVKARGIINATGPFSDEIRRLDEPMVDEIVAPSLGVHVVLPGHLCPANMGLIDPSTSDGRVVFFLPWHGSTLAGTTDAPTTVERQPVAGDGDIDWILSEINRYLGADITVRRSDVTAAWAGIRPLVRDPSADKTEGVVRSHLVTVSPSGLLTCSGGKWTTYREMSEDAVAAAIDQFGLSVKPIKSAPVIGQLDSPEWAAETIELDGSCQTHKVRLVGAHGFSKTLFIHLVQHFGLDPDVARHLAVAYGDRAWTVAQLSTSGQEGKHDHRPARRLSARHPFVEGEVRYAVRHEYAVTAVDVLARRTRLAFLDAKAAVDALPVVIDLMAGELGWSKARRNQEWDDSVSFLASMGLTADQADEARAKRAAERKWW